MTTTELRTDEAAPGRDFTDPARDERDRRQFETGLASLLTWVGSTRPPPGETGFETTWRGADGVPVSHRAVRWAELVRANHLTFVGFWGRRGDADAGEDGGLSEELSEALAEVFGPGECLSLSAWSPDPGEVVGFALGGRGGDGLLPLAQRLAAAYDPLRVHAGELAGGLGGRASLRLTRSAYTEAGDPAPWVAVRDHDRNKEAP